MCVSDIMTGRIQTAIER